MRKTILILGIIIVTVSACSKSDNKKDNTSANCFECNVKNTVVKYCKKNDNTATITAGGETQEDNFGNGWEKYVEETKAGVTILGGSCK